jgi:hypothetical protein
MCLINLVLSVWIIFCILYIHIACYKLSPFASFSKSVLVSGWCLSLLFLQCAVISVVTVIWLFFTNIHYHMYNFTRVKLFLSEACWIWKQLHSPTFRLQRCIFRWPPFRLGSGNNFNFSNVIPKQLHWYAAREMNRNSLQVEPVVFYSGTQPVSVYQLRSYLVFVQLLW